MKYIRRLLIPNPEIEPKEGILFALFTALFFFLFLAIFQPFGVNNYDPHEELRETFVFGLSVFCIVGFLALLTNEVLFRKLFYSFIDDLNIYIWFLWSSFWLSIMMYLAYNILGGWHDFGFFSYLDFAKNVSLLYLIPFIGLFIYARIRDLNETLNSYYQYDSKIGEGEQILLFKSENSNESLRIRLDSLLLIRSEDNYISIFYLNNNELKRELLRGSLKSIINENIHPSLFRVHRSYVVNLYHLLQLKGNRNKMEVYLRNYNESIPVSRQYIDELREVINS